MVDENQLQTKEVLKLIRQGKMTYKETKVIEGQYQGVKKKLFTSSCPTWHLYLRNGFSPRIQISLFCFIGVCLVSD